MKSDSVLIPIYSQPNVRDPYVRGKDRPGITNICTYPTNTLNLSIDGGCYLCYCEGWLPISVGDILDFESFEEIWQTDVAKTIQQDVADQKFTYCAVEACEIAFPGARHARSSYDITVDLDQSCNLACPSCRREIINIVNGPKFDLTIRRVNHFKKLLEKFDKNLRLTMIGSGDPLASLAFRPIILNWQPRSNQSITLFTNGLLINKLLPNSTILAHIEHFQISIDAGSKDVYEDVRRPGRFQNLIANLDWLHDNRPSNAAVTLKFTLSAGNAGDIENFVNLVRHYGFQGEITKLVDLRTWDDFSEHDVVDNEDHPKRQSALDGLRYAAQYPEIHIARNLRPFYGSR